MIRWMAVLAASVVCLVWAGRGALGARKAASASRADLSRVVEQAQSLTRIRAAVPSDRKPGSGLAGRVSGAISRAGLQPAALSSLSPESSVAAGVGYRRQRATLVLAGLTLPQLGSFLDAWRTAEPAWVVATLDLSPAPPPSPTPGADLPLRCTIGLQAVYLESTGEKP